MSRKTFPKYSLLRKTHSKKEPSDLNLFKDMCDLMFEIATEDDDQYQSKAKYLNQHISKWIQTNDTKENSISIKEVSNEDSKILRQKNISNLREPTIKYRDCYRCALPMTPGHIQYCEGIDATCRYCGTKGHVKDACGKLGFFPGVTNPRKTNSRCVSASGNPYKCRRSTDQ